MLPIVSAEDLGNPARPGEYLVDGIHYEIEPKHVEAWRQDPLVRFHTILQNRVNDDRDRLILGSPA